MKHPNNRILQRTALLILPGLFSFFCCDAPYSAAYALGTVLAGLPQAAAVLLLTRKRETLIFPPRLLHLCRIYALFYAAWLTVRFRGICRDLLLPYCGLMLLLLLLMLLYTVKQPDAAAGRAAELLLFTAAAGFLLLPFGGFRSLRGISLFMPDSIAAGFFRELRFSGELPLIPLLMRNQPAKSVRRGLTAWAVFRGIFLPLLILFGAMQNGRLRGSIGNPFFLLLARSPLTEAIRTDGFWMLLAFACGGLCITVCLQAALPDHGKRRLLRIFLPYFAAFALFALLPAAQTALPAAAAGLLLSAVLSHKERSCPA